MALVKRGDVYYAVVNIDGKQVWRSLGITGAATGANQEEAEKAHEALRESARIKSGFAVVGGAVAFATAKQLWLDMRQGHPKSTFNKDRLALDLLEEYAKPELLSDVSPDTLVRLDMKLKKEKRGLHARFNIMRCLKRFVRYAEENPKTFGKLDPQLWRSARLDEKLPRGRKDCYEGDELKALFNACSGMMRTLFVLCLGAGLRRGEAYWLRRDEIDFKRKLILIRAKRDESGALLWAAKGSKEREVDMSPDVAHFLKVWFTITASEWVLCDPNGYRWKNLDSLTKSWHEVVKRSGVSHGCIHVLRHTYATKLLEDGARLRYVQGQMGHDNGNTTELYSHRLSKAQPIDAQALRSVSSVVAAGILPSPAAGAMVPFLPAP